MIVENSGMRQALAGIDDGWQGRSFENDGVVRIFG